MVEKVRAALAESGDQKYEIAGFVRQQGWNEMAELSPITGHGHHWFGNAVSYFLIGDALGEGMKKLLK